MDFSEEVKSLSITGKEYFEGNVIDSIIKQPQAFILDNEAEHCI